jgi:DNA-binding transcriptional LysR family regulator
VDLGHLLTFRTVVELGSFSKAAQALDLSQPAVSQQIRSLEKRLGQRLLDRGGRRVEVTPAGDILYAAACRMLETEERLLSDLSHASEQIAGRLAIGSSTGPGELLLPRLCAEFAAAHPDVRVVMEVHDSRTVCDRVLDGAVEIGFVGAESAQRGLAFEPVITDELVLITPPDHTLASASTITVAELADVPMVVQQKGSGVRAVVEQAFAAQGLRRGPDATTMEMGLQQSAKAVVLDGLGVTVISRAAVEREVAQGALAMVGITEPALRRDFHAVWREGRTLTRSGAVFLDFARGSLAALA